MKQNICLVTGGAGFIGSHVVDELIKIKYRVIVLDDLSGGFERNINKKTIFIKGSINNEKLLNEIFKKYKINYIFHLAAYAAEGLSHFIRKFNYKNNLIGSINLINRAVRNNIRHFVFTSSIAVYGANQTPMLESLTPTPEDPYGIAKYAIELDLKNAYRMFGLKYTIFRPHNVYGERQNHGDSYRNVIGIFMNNIMLNKPMTIFGDGKQQRAFSYIKDVAPYIVQSINNPKAVNEVINIGADTPYSVLELAQVVAKHMGVKPKIINLPARNEVKIAYSDHSKAKKIFNVSKFVSLENGIKIMALWSKKIGPLKSRKFKKIEIYKNMPPSWRKLSN